MNMRETYVLAAFTLLMLSSPVSAKIKNPNAEATVTVRDLCNIDIKIKMVLWQNVLAARGIDSAASGCSVRSDGVGACTLSFSNKKLAVAAFNAPEFLQRTIASIIFSPTEVWYSNQKLDKEEIILNFFSYDLETSEISLIGSVLGSKRNTEKTF